MQDMKMTDQVAGYENDGPSKSQGVKMQDMNTQDMKMQDMKLLDWKMQDTKIVYLPCIYLVLVCNALIWCSMFTGSVRMGLVFFLLWSLRLPGYNEN